jgi:hypothetical protein
MKGERTKQAVQDAHDVLKACALAVAKLRSDNKSEDLTANDLHTSATQTLRRTCKAVHQKARGAILFLERKTALRVDYMTTIDDDHNNGVANNGVANNGVANNGVANNGVHNNGVANNVDGVDSECGGPSTSPLCQSNCLAPTSPIRAGSSRRVIANRGVNPAVDTRLSDRTAYHLVDPTAYHLVDTTPVDTTAYHLVDTTQPASKKQRVAPPTEGHFLYLPGGYGPLSSPYDFATTFNTNCIPLPDLLMPNAFDDVIAIAFVEVASEFVIGKTGTALADPSERGHTPYQVKKHTALVGALLASRTSGKLSAGYDNGSFNRLKSKMTNCISNDKGRFVKYASQHKASLLPSASGAAAAKSTPRIAISNWVELLFGDRLAALEGAIVKNNLLRSCTMNMMQCGGDKSGYIHTGADGAKTSSQCTDCLCEKLTCIFTLMSTVVGSKVFGSDTTHHLCGREAGARAYRGPGNASLRIHECHP